MNSPSFRPPLTVHVFWSARSRHPICPRLGQTLYEFLCRPLDPKTTSNPAVEIPVLMGNQAQEIATLLEYPMEGRAPGGDLLASPLIVAVPLLDGDARQDGEFMAALARIKRAAARESAEVLLLPILLDRGWRDFDGIVFDETAHGENRLEPALRMLEEEVGVRICQYLMRHADATRIPRVRILVSHDQQGPARESKLAADLGAHVGRRHFKNFVDAGDIERTLSVAEQLDEAGRAVVFLSLRTDQYAESTRCQDDVLGAKKYGVPIVSVYALVNSELRSLAYGGNSFTIVSKFTAGESNPETSVKEATDDEIGKIARICLQAWLRHIHFHYSAPQLFKRHRLPLDPHYLSRAPELFDFAHNLLSREAVTLVIHPDPPLPQAEIAAIRNAHPKVRLATPTALDRELLRRVAAPALDGLRIAVSLSDSPEIPDLLKMVVSGGPAESRGLTNQHMKGVVRHLTLNLLRAGVELGYGGNLSVHGFTQDLSETIEAYKRTTKSSRDLLFNYVADYLWKQEDADAISAHFIRVGADVPETVSADVRGALDLATMRRKMAEDCFARVILGGKTAPKSPTFPGGYSGRLPGQAEEAWRHLAEGKPLYVAGGFLGSARWVADALCGKDRPAPSETEEQRDNPAYRDLCAGVDAAPASLGLRIDNGRDGLWDFFVEQGRGVFHGAGADNSKTWINGLTVDENRRLFESIHPEEISSLVLTGLLRVQRSRRAGGGAALKVVLFHGSITDIPDVDSYVVPVLRGAPLRGADGALDAAMDGAIQRHLQTGSVEALVPVKGGRLPGDYVLLQTIGDLNDLAVETHPKEDRWLTANIVTGMKEIVERAARLGLDSPAFVPFGSNLGLTIREAVLAMLRGLLAADAGSSLQNIALCEVDPDRYRAIRELMEIIKGADSGGAADDDLAALAGKVEFTELRSDGGVFAPPVARSAILLVVQRTEEGLSVFAHASGSGTSVAMEQMKIEWSEIRRIIYPSMDRSPPIYEQQESSGQRLALAVLPPAVRELLLEHPRTPLDILHDLEASAIPFEMLCLPTAEASAPHRPALVGGIRRCLLSENVPRRYRIHSSQLRLNLLLVVSDPARTLRQAGPESKEITKVFADRGDILIEPLVGPGLATREAVLDRLSSRRFDILHFIGHAEFNSRDPASSGLEMADGVLLAGDLKKAKFASLPGVVILNACEAGRMRDVTPRPETGPNLMEDGSVAQAFISEGIQAFLGNLWKVDDRAAFEFSISLYQSLAAGQSLGEAVLAARQKLFNQHQSDWLNFMLFGNAGWRI